MESPNTYSHYIRVADEKRLKFILDNLKESVSPQASVLDVGCGNGIISTNLAKHGYNVLGIDVSDKAIETARKNNTQPNLNYRVMSAEELVSEPENYDAIVCSEVIEHLHNPSDLLSKLFIALKKDGVLIVTVPNGKGPREVLVTKPTIQLRKKGGWMWKSIIAVKKALGYSGTTIQSDADDLDHVQFFSKRDLLTLLQANKFTLLKFGKANFMDDVFPISFVTKRIKFLQRVDSAVADLLPYHFTGGFNTLWKKS